jgi:hypothetical protein
MMMILEQSVEGELAGETEVLGENLPPGPLCPPQILHDLTRARIRAEKPATNRLSYGKAPQSG